MASHSEGSESGRHPQQQSQQESVYQEGDDDLQLIDEEEDIGGTESEQQVQGESSGPSTKGKSTKDDDKKVRRKLQNMVNQRRYRQRKKEREEAEKRETENQDKATSSYVTSDPAELQSSSDLSGIPWGGLNMQYIVGRNRSREDRSRQTSREPSRIRESRAGGSSRLGLNLTDRFWRRRYPPLQTFKKYLGKDSS